MTICTRTAKCHFCNEPILVKTPIVKGKLWRKMGEVKKWTFWMYWHPQCWVEEGLVAVSKMRYNPGNKGRKPKEITYIDKKARNKILCRRAAFVQRMRQAMDDGNIDRVLRLHTAMSKLNKEIEQYGGIPESWLSQQEQQQLQNSSHQSTQKSLPSAHLALQESTTGYRWKLGLPYGYVSGVKGLEPSILLLASPVSSVPNSL
jgi:hypothetical protein